MRTTRAVAATLATCLIAGGILAFPPPAVSATKSTTITRLLNELLVAPERPQGYDRDRFSPWITINGCDTRQRVLARQNLNPNRLDCGASRGRWFSVYDGASTRNPSTFDIDHTVPLAEAWESGADTWSGARRDRYANDLGYTPSLIAVTASSNRSKGEQDPAEWMPPRRSYGCAYLRRWVAVKYRWGLSVDSSEKSFLARGLRPCPQTIPTPPLAR